MTTMAPTTFDAYKLMHEGTLALADIEEYGMRVDRDYIKRADRKLRIQIARQERKLLKLKEVKLWKKKYGNRFNLESNNQLSTIIYDVLNLGGETETKSVAVEALEQIDSPIVNQIVHYRRLKKTKNTYLKNYTREEVDGILHPFFHLSTVTSFRSSSSKINFQNQPVRIPFVKRFVRQAVVPRDGFAIGEIDYSGVEVTVAACYHKDKNMIADIIDPKRDMHRDMASECFKLDKKEVTKDVRYCGKNMFVFPQFYGDYYKTCATSMWNAINLLKLKTVNGTPLRVHLKKQGIRSYTQFEKHIQRVEDYFWNERYPDYAAWKDDHWESYLEKGYVTSLTGFTYSGLMSRNEAINYPIQGAAFHCLLWSLIRINRYIKKNNLKSRIIGQIHDSIVFEFWPPEINSLMQEVTRIATQNVRTYWSWIIIPLEIEFELCRPDESWFHKKEVVREEVCDCGMEWLYASEENGAKKWECPLCGDVYVGQA